MDLKGWNEVWTSLMKPWGTPLSPGYKTINFQFNEKRSCEFSADNCSVSLTLPPTAIRKVHFIISEETSRREKPSFSVWLPDSHLAEQPRQKLHSIHQQLSKYRNPNNHGTPWAANLRKKKKNKQTKKKKSFFPIHHPPQHWMDASSSICCFNPAVLISLH